MFDEQPDGDPHGECAAEIHRLQAENARLSALLNTPETLRFLEGTRLEVAHQVERWGTVHDRAKEPADWFWLLGYLSGKALAAHAKGDTEKAMHHCISSAAVLANWHTHIALGAGLMTPGSSDLQEFLRETFGANFTEYQADAQTKAAQPAECKRCQGTGMVDDGYLTHSEGGIEYESGPIKCVKDCPACNGRNAPPL